MCVCVGAFGVQSKRENKPSHYMQRHSVRKYYTDWEARLHHERQTDAKKKTKLQMNALSCLKKKKHALLKKKEKRKKANESKYIIAASTSAVETT